jgi:acylpyruvate hydrolase
MKLATLLNSGAPRPAVLIGGELTPLDALFDACAPAGSPPAPASLLALLHGGQAAWDALRAAAERASREGTPPGALPLEAAILDAPLRAPGKVIGVGLNYADHCREQNIDPPRSPVLFAKFPSAIIGPGETIRLPGAISQQVDYEAELAVVIGREARQVSEADAYNVVAGYMIANDVSARDVQFGDGQWVRGKSFDTFCPIGPYLVTADEAPDPHTLGIRCRVNGQTLQDSNTGEMIFSIPTLIAFITQAITLLPGDIISTGTPHGVGVFRDPKVFLRPGDVVEVEIDGLGVLRNPVGEAG